MQTLAEVKTNNVSIKQDIISVANKVNYHSQVMANHDSEIQRIAAEVSDLQQAHTDSHVKAELIVSGLPLGLQQPPDDVANAIFAHIGLDDKFAAAHKGPARLVNSKKPQPSSTSIIIRMFSSEACDMVLEAASRKRRTSKLYVNNILGGDGDAVFYINKMQSSYLANLAFQAREAKRRLGWKGVWTNNGNISIKVNEQSPAISISLLAQLEALTK